MAEKDIGALVVLDGELAGIFSERDYARKVILQGKVLQGDARERDHDRTRSCACEPDQSVEECMALMTDKRIRHLPVLEDQKVIGVISIGDVVKEVISEQRFVIEQLEHYIHS